MRKPNDAPAYEGRRGFEHLSTNRLGETLKRYRRLRNEARNDATRLYASSCINEIHNEVARRRGSTPEAA